MTGDQQKKSWIDTFRRPAVMVAIGVLNLTLALDGATGFLPWGTKVGSPLAIGQTISCGLAGIGILMLAFTQHRQRAQTLVKDREPPAWTRWAVSLAAVAGAVMGGGFAYWEAKTLDWTPAAATLLAVTCTVVTIVVFWFILRMVRKQQKLRQNV